MVQERNSTIDKRSV